MRVQVNGVKPRLVKHGFVLGFVRLRAGLRLHGGIGTRRPGAVHHQAQQYQAANDGQTQLKITHGVILIYAACTKPTAASMSTATMRETPCSCMVTPMSCSAISMAILLWLMNKNWVLALMLVTSLA